MCAVFFSLNWIVLCVHPHLCFFAKQVCAPLPCWQSPSVVEQRAPKTPRGACCCRATARTFYTAVGRRAVQRGHRCGSSCSCFAARAKQSVPQAVGCRNSLGWSPCHTTVTFALYFATLQRRCHTKRRCWYPRPARCRSPSSKQATFQSGATPGHSGLCCTKTCSRIFLVTGQFYIIVIKLGVSKQVCGH